MLYSYQFWLAFKKKFELLCMVNQIVSKRISIPLPLKISSRCNFTIEKSFLSPCHPLDNSSRNSDSGAIVVHDTVSVYGFNLNSRQQRSKTNPLSSFTPLHFHVYQSRKFRIISRSEPPSDSFPFSHYTPSSKC